jgi:hypothetical protein
MVRNGSKSVNLKFSIGFIGRFYRRVMAGWAPLLIPRADRTRYGLPIS